MAQLQAKREIKAKYNLLSLNKEEQTQLYKYIILSGNNSDVVKRVMEARPSWVQIKSSQTLYHFKWSPVSRQIKFDFLCKHGQKNLVNHFENHSLITTKDQLYHNMQKLSENLHQDVFDYLPLTFVIDLGTSMCGMEYDKFHYFFNVIEKYRQQFIEMKGNDEQQAQILQNINTTMQSHLQMTEKKRSSRNMTLRDSMFDGENIWLLKPNDANRGRGVHLFNSLEQMKRLLLELTSRAESKQFQHFAQNTLKIEPPSTSASQQQETTNSITVGASTASAAG